MFRYATIKLIFITATVTILFYSCKPEDDTIDPVILLKGANPYNVDSIGGSFQEPGFTAVDENDGDITNKVVVQYPIIMNDSSKSYQVNYRVTDYAGNIFTTYRIINIRNTIAFLEGVYNDTLKCDNDSDVFYQSTIIPSPVINGNFGISNFANKGSQAVLNGTFDSGGNLTFQTPVSLLDSDSTVVLNIVSGNLTLDPKFRLELLFDVKNDTIPGSRQCRVIMVR